MSVVMPPATAIADRYDCCVSFVVQMLMRVGPRHWARTQHMGELWAPLVGPPTIVS